MIRDLVDSWLARSVRSRLVRILKGITTTEMRRSVYDFVYFERIMRSPDRIYLENSILSSLITADFKRVLSVGCRKYTTSFTDGLRENGTEVWTLEIDPKAARFGVPGRHIVGDATCLDLIEQCFGFEVIVLNGVLGFGINSAEQIDRTFAGLTRVLEPGKLLVLGWDTDRIPDPERYWRAHGFAYADHCDLGHRKTFEECNHVFDFLTKPDA